jgi:hypothetical protein
MDGRDGEIATDQTPPEHVVERLGIFLPSEASEWVDAQRDRSDALFVIASPTESQGEHPGAEPAIVIASPALDSTYRLASEVPASSQCIEITAQPNLQSSPAEVRLYVDGTPLATFDKPPYRVLWPLSPGEHSFYAEAEDATGQTWSSRAVKVTVLP